MKKKLFEELTEEEVNELTKVEYDPSTFKYALESMEKEIEMYKELGSDFKAEYREANRMYVALKHINDWMITYNSKNDIDSDEVQRIKSVVRLHVYFDPIAIKSRKFEDYEFCSGLFTCIDLLVIPLSMLGVDTSIQDPDKFMKHLKLKVKDFYLHPELRDSRLPNEVEAIYGSLRVINPTHCAVVVRNQDNPFVDNIYRSSNWRYIHKDGSAC